MFNPKHPATRAKYEQVAALATAGEIERLTEALVELLTMMDDNYWTLAHYLPELPVEPRVAVFRLLAERIRSARRGGPTDWQLAKVREALAESMPGDAPLDVLRQILELAGERWIHPYPTFADIVRSWVRSGRALPPSAVGVPRSTAPEVAIPRWRTWSPSCPICHRSIRVRCGPTRSWPSCRRWASLGRRC